MGFLEKRRQKKIEEAQNQIDELQQFQDSLDIELLKISGLDKLQSDAQNGDPEAQVFVALQFLKGEKVPQSVEKAIKWANKSAKQGCPAGQYLLGSFYQYGNGVEQSLDKAVELYVLAHRQRYAPASKRLFELFNCDTDGSLERKLEEWNLQRR